MKEYVSHVNKIFYSKEDLNSNIKVALGKTFTFGAMAFSWVYRRVKFTLNLEELTGIPDDIALAKINNLLQTPNNNENNCQVHDENESTLNNNDQVQAAIDHEPSSTIEEDFICEPNDNEDSQNSDHSDSDFLIDSEESYSSDDDNLCTKLSKAIKTESDHQRIYVVPPTSVQYIATNS